MADIKNREERRGRRHERVRKTVSGTAERPRLVIYRSTKHLYAQLVNDTDSKTITGVSTLTPTLKEKCAAAKPAEAAREVGLAIAEAAKKHNITKVVFDRGGYPYVGKVKILADAAREGGLQF